MEKPTDRNNDCKICSKCKQSRPLDWFEAETKLCTQCLGHQRAYRQRHKEQIYNYNKTYYQEHKDEVLEKLKEWHKTFIDCFYCKCAVSNRNLSSHVKTNKHIKNMEKYHNNIKYENHK